MAGSRLRDTPRELLALLALSLLLGLWNAHAYPPGRGYDAADHIAYADGLVPGGKLPHGVGEYYTPPGFYAVAGSLDWVGRQAGLGEPHRLVLVLGALLLAGTVLLTWLIAGALGLGRRGAVVASGFVVLVPVAVKAAAMFHPETLELFLCTLALWLTVRLVQRRDPWPVDAAATGIVLGLAQLVRAFSLWTVAAVVIALVAARRGRALVVVLALAVVIPAPWYIHQRQTYGGSPVFNRPTQSKPVWSRRPAAFYVDPGLPSAVTRPYRPHYLNRALPTTYTELWGDYFGVWAWNGKSIGAHALALLRVQSLVGIVPTLAALAGAALLLLRRRRDALAVALVPALGLLGYLYFTVSYPTPDGDVLKGTYMLSTAAAWAIGLGYGVDRLPPRPARLLCLVLALCALAELPFLLY